MSTERWCWPASDGIGSRTPAPWRTNSGAMKSAGARRVSRTIERSVPVRRSRRIRVAGKPIWRSVSAPFTCQHGGDRLAISEREGREMMDGHEQELDYSNEALRKLGARIRHLRRQRAMTQRDLSFDGCS